MLVSETRFGPTISGEPEFPPPDAETLIRAAYDEQDCDRVSALLEAYRQCGEDPSTRFSDLLGDAVIRSRDHMVNCLHEQGVQITGLQAQQAARAGSINLVEKVLDLGWELDRLCGPRRPSLLGQAVQHYDLVVWLLQKGADPNACCADNYTPLSAAVEHGPLPVVEILLAYGGNPQVGQLAHHAVRRKFDVEAIFDKLNKVGAPLNNIYLENISSPTQTEMNLCALDLGTPLHDAVYDKKYQAARCLISYGVVSRPSLRSGKLPEDYASGDEEMLAILAGL